VKSYYDTIQSQAAELAEWNRTLETRVREQVEELEKMSQLGYVRQAPTDSRYMLTTRMWAIGVRAAIRKPLVGSTVSQ